MISPDDKQFSFNWNNHTNHIRQSLAVLLNKSELVDVTLCCEDGKLSAHKMFLSMCSPYFRGIFIENPCPHPIVILKGVNFNIMKNLLKFMYDGEVTIDSDDFDTFIKTAEYLQVTGLTASSEPNEEEKAHTMESPETKKGKRKAQSNKTNR